MAKEGFSKVTVGVDLSSGQDVANVQQYMKQFEQVMKNLTDSGQAFSSAIRRGEKSITKDFYVLSSRMEEASKGFEFVRAKVVGQGDLKREHDPFTFSKPEPVPMESFKRLIDTNKREIAALKASIVKQGGSMEPDKQPGYYNITMPDVETVTATGRPTTAKNQIQKKIRDLNYDTRKAAKADYDSKAQDNYDKFLSGSADKESSEERKMTDKMVAAFKKKPKDADGKPEEEEDGDADGKDTLSSLAKLGSLYLIIKYVQLIADFSKKIFDAISGLSAQTKKDATEGLTVGLSALDIRKYQQAEVLKNLPSGTVAGALHSIVQKFGVPSKMDTKALSDLALVLKGNTAELVGSGLGGKDPEAVMDIIIREYMAQALSGKSAEGIDMPVADAVINLAEHLGKVSPELKNLFLMQFQDLMDRDDPTRSKSAELDTSRWLLFKEAVINPAGFDDANSKELLAINKTLTEIQTLWNGIKNGIFLDIANMLRDVLGGVRNALRIGMTETQRKADIDNARIENTAKLTDARSFERAINTSVNVKSHAIREGIPKNIRDTLTGTDIRVAAAQVSSGLLPTNLNIINAAMADPLFLEKLSSLGSLLVSKNAADEFIKKLEDEIKSPTTQHVVGSVVDNVTAARSKIKKFNLKAIDFELDNLTKSLALRRASGLELPVINAQKALVSQINRNYNTRNNDANFNSALEISNMKELQDSQLKHYIEVALRKMTETATASGKTVVATRAEAVVKDNHLTITLYAGKTKVFEETRSVGMFDTSVTLPVNDAMINDATK
jgi:hypothetical protein